MKKKNFSIDIQKYFAANLTKDEVKLYNHAYRDYNKAKKIIMGKDKRILETKENLNLLYDNDDYPLSQTIYNSEEIRSDMQKHIKIRYRTSMKPVAPKNHEEIKYRKTTRFSLVPY